MALIKCEECGHLISDRAIKCPKCGAEVIKRGMAQQPIHKKRHTTLSILIVVIGVCILVFVAFYFWFFHRHTMSHDLSSSNEATSYSDYATDYDRNQPPADTICEQTSKDNGKGYNIEDVRNAYIKRIKDWEQSILSEEDGDLYYGVGYYGYFLFDITHDGIPDLWVTTGTCEADRKFFVYSYTDGGLKEIYKGGNDHSSFHFGEDYVIRMCAHMGYAHWTKITYEDGKVDEKKIFEEDTTVDDRDYTMPKERRVQEYSWDDMTPINRMSSN